MADVDSITSETWKDIPTIPGYKASHLGRIHSFWKTVGGGSNRKRVLVQSPKIIKQGVSARGYLVIRATDLSGRSRNFQVHRLVLEAFVGPCPENHEGCHKDGNRLNPRLDNLYWGTHTDNCLDTQMHGRNKNAVVHPWDFERVLEMDNQGLTQQEIGDHFGIGQNAVSNILLRQGVRKIRKNYTPEERAEIVQMFDRGMTPNDIASELGEFYNSVWKIIRKEVLKRKSTA